MRNCLCLAALVLLIPQGIGGGVDGDPAPGRSPGPPPSRHSSVTAKMTIEENIQMEAFQQEGNDSVCRENVVLGPEKTYINVSFYHPLFDVNSHLLPGISYYVFVDTVGGEDGIEEVFVSTTSAGKFSSSWENRTFRMICAAGAWIAKNLEDPAPLLWMASHSEPEPLNITFRFRYRISTGLILEENVTQTLTNECLLKLRPSAASFESSDLPEAAETCRIEFPRKLQAPESPRREGLLVELTKLNVPCSSGGYVQFATDDRQESDRLPTEAKKLCGKLEELALGERKMYFPAVSESNSPVLIVHKNKYFKLNYTLVDYCYNITFATRNGSLVLNPVKNLLCHFRIHLPYGNRVLLRLQMGEDRIGTTVSAAADGTGPPKTDAEEESERDCDGLLVVVWNGDRTWTHCSRRGDPKRDVQVWSQENVVTMRVAARVAPDGALPVLKFWYHAEPVPELVGPCEFGEVLVKNLCISAVYLRLDWDRAEQYCAERGGHLASIRDESAQNTVDSYLINSPDYRDHNSFWIGASDKIYEGHFKWSDGFVFSYANWFLGWSGFSNRQPNDDGFSHQDCVEIRRVFPYSASARVTNSITPSFLWNDLDCERKNFFLCERFRSGESIEQAWAQECNRTIALSREHPKATVVSPGFPHRYPDNVRCETLVRTIPGYRIVLDFEELVIENESSCGYDYLEITEIVRNETVKARKLCGDMSDMLKLLRYISRGPSLKLVFVSDYSRHYGGFKARASIESAGMECADDKHHRYNGSCYLFVSYPKVSWQTARQICTGMKADLASVQSADEESFITRNIRSSIEYSTSSIYWLGGHVDSSDKWIWTDNSPMEFSAWVPDEGLDNSVTGNGQSSCLAVRWMSAGTESDQLSGLYWTKEQCKKTGGYVCKKINEVSGESMDLNRTIEGTEGHLTSPGYPGPYLPNLDYFVHLVGPKWTRMVVTFNKLDLEPQTECLYDFIELRSAGAKNAEARWCSSRSSKSDSRESFVSNNNEALIRFHSDYSIAGSGFSASWRAIDVTSCPSQKLTAREGIVTSPNYGEFLLPRLDCTTMILAPPGKRIWLEFTESDVSGDGKRNQKDAVLEIDLGAEKTLKPFRNERSIGDGTFISLGEKLSIRLKTGDHPRGIGFRALYRTVGAVHEERVLELTEDTEGFIHHLNYPTNPPPYIDFVQHLIAPMGYVISLDFHQVTFSELGSSCPDGLGIIEVNDNYDEANKTWRFLCQIDDYADHFLLDAPRVSITSFFNSLHIRQRSSLVGVKMNVTVKVLPDVNFRLKLIRSPKDGNVESCHPNPCQNGGKCVKKKCECISHFTGMFCALTHCDLQPCDHGQCELTETGYRCRCHTGYVGHTCDVRLRPCALNPCEGRGDCIDNERTNSFHCRCHAWWEGPRCERKMMHIPFKPLSERMLQEPFWLGLITVFVVLGVIGIVWCAKRHFPEKLEKLLAEEADKHGRSNVSGSIRQPSLREQVIASSGAVPVPSPQGTANCPRTLFGRLGIRKSSILSLTSPHRQDGANSRTFSLDDLLRPSPRRTPSPRKKRTNSTPTKKNPSEKKQILQQLISPSSNPSNERTKVHFDELILLNEHGGYSERQCDKAEEWRESSFSKTDPKSDLCKLEKKVTFARLLNKVSAEMSSGSEVENTSSATQNKAVSTPASPATDRKGSHSMSSNQGSDSLSGSEIAISGSAGNSLLDIPDSTRRPTKLLSNRGMRNSSADSILAMFRNFTSNSNTSRMSPTSTISSPQDDRGISDDSSAVETPVSTSSGLDSPLRRAITIDVQVMDPLTAQKTVVSSNNHLQPPSVLLEIPSGGISKCLSPIHEVPTPIASPALTPIMPRTEPPVKISIDTSDEESMTDDGNESENSSEMMIEIHQEDDGNAADTPSSCDIKIPVAGKSRPPLLTIPQKEPPQNLVIPILTVQEPSPTSTSPPCSFLGSPPPQKAMDTFIFVTESSPRKCFKEKDKPNSLDLPYPPPMITITCNSGVDSDTESISPAKNSTLGPHTQGNSGMCYLSPFSMGSRADRTASESNLSSSGYSSMASPGPSRCGSNNPLCLSEVEDHQQSHSQPPSRRPSPLLRTPLVNNAEQDHHRGRSDSETLSDDPLMESNDEGIGTDHLEEKIEEGDLKSARELEIYLGKEQSFMDFSALAVPTQRSNRDCITPPKASLQLPTIIVQSDCCDKLLSPVSSRSESPLSDKTLGLGRFSPMFYNKNKNDPLPFTDSDGLYDFPSSDCIPSNNKGVQAGVSSHRKSTGRRRERRSSYRGGSKASSPTAVPSTLLDIPARDTTVHRCQRKPSPKRRVRNQQPLSSSSSTESLHSMNGIMEDWPDANPRIPASNEASGEETGEDRQTSAAKESGTDNLKSQRKISGFRTIGHQIRFLRRLELSLKRKERLASLLDSGGEDDLDDVSSSLLPRELKKGSISILQQQTSPKRHRNLKRRSVEQLPRGYSKRE